MKRNTFLTIAAISLTFLSVSGQDDAEYVKTHAVRIENPEKLNNSVYTSLSPFQMILFGEMHGTNESTPFVLGLTNLFTNLGDSVQVGLEIPSSLMTRFISLHTESSVFQSDFFYKQPPLSGKETFAWANLIVKLNDNPKVQIFFFDMNEGEGKPYQRDSMMSEKIIAQHAKHPSWKIVTLSGNYHNRISGEPSMAFFLGRDKQLKICSLNMEYVGGSCLANVGRGLELKQLGSYPSAYNSTLPWDHFLLLVSPGSGYQYHGFYFTQQITASTLTPHE